MTQRESLPQKRICSGTDKLGECVARVGLLEGLHSKRGVGPQKLRDSWRHLRLSHLHDLRDLAQSGVPVDRAGSKVGKNCLELCVELAGCHAHRLNPWVRRLQQRPCKRLLKARVHISEILDRTHQGLLD